MSLADLFTGTFALYRKTASGTYPFTPTWASVATIPCYTSAKMLDTVTDDGRMLHYEEMRFRTEPYSWQDGDRIYFNSKIYETISYENFDNLSMEAVTIGKKLDDQFITEMGIV